MEKKQPIYLFVWRVTALHTITYFFIGLLALTVINYKDLFESEGLNLLMKSVDSPIVALGPSLQIIRGIILGFILWLIKDTFLYQKNGWLKLWIIISSLTIFLTAGPAPGSFEGFIYTTIPVVNQLLGLPEVLLQSVCFSFFLILWYKKPNIIWNIITIILIVLILLMSFAGYFLA